MPLQSQVSVEDTECKNRYIGQYDSEKTLEKPGFLCKREQVSQKKEQYKQAKGVGDAVGKRQRYYVQTKLDENPHQSDIQQILQKNNSSHKRVTICTIPKTQHQGIPCAEYHENQIRPEHQGCQRC